MRRVEAIVGRSEIMMKQWVGALAILGFTATPIAAAPPKDKPSADDVKKAEKLVGDRLGELKAEGGKVDRITDDAVDRAFPGYLFFSVLFRQYPVGRAVPEPLKPSSLFAVSPEGKLKLLTDIKELETYFKEALEPVKTDKAAQDAALAWLRFTEQLKQDGFYEFKTVEEASKVETVKEIRTASARGAATKGGNGEINVALTFDDKGKLTKVAEKSDLKPGPRPICHATKLLDPDPLVRRIVEQDLLIMGRPAKDYLDEQRAKADPELQKAIDRIWQLILDAER
jgi:hypothetical protein